MTMPHLSGGWIILARENMDFDDFVLNIWEK